MEAPDPSLQGSTVYSRFNHFSSVSRRAFRLIFAAGDLPPPVPPKPPNRPTPQTTDPNPERRVLNPAPRVSDSVPRTVPQVRPHRQYLELNDGTFRLWEGNLTVTDGSESDPQFFQVLARFSVKRPRLINGRRIRKHKRVRVNLINNSAGHHFLVFADNDQEDKLR